MWNSKKQKPSSMTLEGFFELNKIKYAQSNK